MLFSCKKVAFYNDSCTGDCYILSGKVYDDSSGLPLENVSIILKANNGIFVKGVVETYSDDTGHWKVSFDSDYIEDISEGTITYDLNGYLYKIEEVTFTSAELNTEKIYSNTIHKAGTVYFDMTITNPEIERVQARYYFEGKNYMIYTTTNGYKPLHTSLSHLVPANKDIAISLWYSLNSNTGDQTNWTMINGFPINMNVGSLETDTISVSF
ncbi:MAG: hypothetical protein IPH24_03490 [Crocinitomicaceae bacterium]|nr:hypothetical protein [Crocinitomicaceae bacterium]